MNQLTTIAALPNGAGQAAHLPAEVGETPTPVGGLYNGWGERIGDAPLAAALKVSPVRKYAGKCPFKFTDPDLLDTSE